MKISPGLSYLKCVSSYRFCNWTMNVSWDARQPSHATVKTSSHRTRHSVTGLVISQQTTVHQCAKHLQKWNIGDFLGTGREQGTGNGTVSFCSLNWKPDISRVTEYWCFGIRIAWNRLPVPRSLWPGYKSKLLSWNSLCIRISQITLAWEGWRGQSSNQGWSWRGKTYKPNSQAYTHMNTHIHW